MVIRALELQCRPLNVWPVSRGKDLICSRESVPAQVKSFFLLSFIPLDSSYDCFVICLFRNLSHFSFHPPPARHEAQVICLGLTEMTAFKLC